MKRLSLAIALLGGFSIANAQTEESFLSKLQPEIQYTKPGDKTGLNQFETTKEETVPYEGLKVKFGAGFSLIVLNCLNTFQQYFVAGSQAFAYNVHIG